MQNSKAESNRFPFRIIPFTNNTKQSMFEFLTAQTRGKLDKESTQEWKRALIKKTAYRLLQDLSDQQSVEIFKQVNKQFVKTLSVNFIIADSLRDNQLLENLHQLFNFKSNTLSQFQLSTNICLNSRISYGLVVSSLKLAHEFHNQSIESIKIIINMEGQETLETQDLKELVDVHFRKKFEKLNKIDLSLTGFLEDSFSDLIKNTLPHLYSDKLQVLVLDFSNSYLTNEFIHQLFQSLQSLRLQKQKLKLSNTYGYDLEKSLKELEEGQKMLKHYELDFGQVQLSDFFMKYVINQVSVQTTTLSLKVPFTGLDHISLQTLSENFDNLQFQELQLDLTNLVSSFQLLQFITHLLKTQKNLSSLVVICNSCYDLAQIQTQGEQLPDSISNLKKLQLEINNFAFKPEYLRILQNVLQVLNCLKELRLSLENCRLYDEEIGSILENIFDNCNLQDLSINIRFNMLKQLSASKLIKIDNLTKLINLQFYADPKIERIALICAKRIPNLLRFERQSVIPPDFHIKLIRRRKAINWIHFIKEQSKNLKTSQKLIKQVWTNDFLIDTIKFIT